MVDILGAIGTAASQAGAAISSGFNDYITKNQSNNSDWGSQVLGTVARGAALVAAPFVAAPVAGAVVLGAAKSYYDSQPAFKGGSGSEYNAEGYTYESAGGAASDLKPIRSEPESGNSFGVDKGAPAGEFSVTYKEENINRPGYTKVSDLGLDRKTWVLVAKGSSPLKAVTKRLESETNPKIRRELDWQQGKLLQNEIEASSAEHYFKKESINPADWTFNTRENIGDMALAIKEGTRQESKLQLARSNPAIMGVMQALPEKDYVPGGMGWGDITWENAKSGYTAKTPGLTQAVEMLETARRNKDYGVYGQLYPGLGREVTEWNPPVTRTRKVPVDESTDYYDYNTGAEEYRPPKNIGGFGRKPKAGKSARNIMASESEILREMGLTQPFNKKEHRNKPLGKVKYSVKTDNFQSMRKNYTNHPPKKASYTEVDETDILKEIGILQKSRRCKTPNSKFGGI
jgi:hypothetical protein